MTLSLSELKKLRAAITPGEWLVTSWDGDYRVVTEDSDSIASYTKVYPECSIGLEKGDAEFIAASPSIADIAIKALEENGRLKKALGREPSELDWTCQSCNETYNAALVTVHSCKGIYHQLEEAKFRAQAAEDVALDETYDSWLGDTPSLVGHIKSLIESRIKELKAEQNKQGEK